MAATPAPKRIDDTTLRLFGPGPTCPGCSGPTYAVTASGTRPWWCPECNVRLTDAGEPGAQAYFNK